MRTKGIIRYVIVGMLGALALFSSASFAVDSTAITYQGTLRNAAGVPVADGTYAMVFSIYDALANGNQVWTENHAAVTTKDGLFSVFLGETTSFGTIFSAYSSLYVEVSANTGSGPEVYSPRVPLTCAPYAQQAANASAVGGMTSATLASQMDSKDTAAINTHNNSNSAHPDIRDALAANTPPGVVAVFASNTIPTGWLLCDGSLVSRSTYAALFTAIGTVYGAGDGSTTFALPNLSGRVAVGKGTAPFGALGNMGGEITHKLTVAEMPSHTHTQNAHAHAITNGLNGPNGLSASSGSGGDDGNWCFTDVTQASQPWGAFMANWATATNQSTGGDGAHNVLQPYMVMNYVIKY